MKKLMTILVVFAMCGVAMAAGSSSNVIGTDSAAVQIPLTNGQHDYINFKDITTQGNSGLTYTVTNSYSPHTGHNVGHVYFTTMSQADVDAFNAANHTNVQKVTVQFVGAQDEYSNTSNTKQWKVTDYGIYLYDPKNPNAAVTYMSAKANNGTFEIDPGKSFGVYYEGTERDNGRTQKLTVTSTKNWVGNYDTGNGEGDKAGQNQITVYDYNEEGVIAPEEGWTFKKFMCLFQTKNTEMVHWEFMLQTRLDDPKVSVTPDDVTEELPPASGQPLPGTLATLLIGSLCAGSLRKRNKKH